MKPMMSVDSIPKVLKRLFPILVMCLAACSLTDRFGCGAEVDSRSMTSLTEEERRTKFEEDLVLVRRYDDGLAQVMRYAQGRPDLFPRDEAVVLSKAQKLELLGIWSVVLDYMRALDGIKEYWRKFYEFQALTERRAHAEAFLAGYAAWMVQYRHGLDFVDLTVPSKPMEKILDAAAPRHDVPDGAFASLKWNIIHVKAVTRMLSKAQYYKTVEGALTDADCDRKEWCGWGMQAVDSYHDEAKEQLKDRAAVQFSYNAFDITRDATFQAWFPVQKNVAAWMGDTKVARLHDHLIEPEQLQEMRPSLEPGDIIVARHNWYLSNVGLPGFWPHAEFYLGSKEELAAYFDDPEVKEHFSTYRDASDLPSYLENNYPSAWSAYAAPSTPPPRVIEAISEGVVFSTLERAAGADYVGVMRPNRTKLEKAIAIGRAFELYGRPYDFNFDFVTDESLVCTELVYKAWLPTENSRGLEFELTKVAGRQTLPANDLVAQFAEREGEDLQFVYFLDGREREKTAVVGDATAFRESWKRPKWDIVQK